MAKKFIFFLYSSFFILHFSFAQTRMRDIYAVAPDSIFPLLTKNNRLDFDAHAELLVLNDNYLKLQLSKHCLVEMRLLPDSTFCMVQTYNAPAPDSHIRLFDTKWNELPRTIERPSVDEFLSEDVDIDARLALQALPLIKASLSENDDTITFELQTSELTRDQQKSVEGKAHKIIKELGM